MKQLTREEVTHADKLKEMRQQIAMFMRTEGWALMKASFEAAARTNYEKMVGSENPHTSAKCMGAYHVCKDVAGWPEQQVESLDAALRAILTE